MTEPTEHHQHADLPQGDAPRPDLPQPDVSEPGGIAALISHRISRRTLGKLAIGPAVAASMASLGLAGATPAVATPGQLTRAEFLAMISDYFDWVHSSEYIDPYKLPQPTFHDVQLGKTPYAKQVETALEEKVVGNDRAMFLPRQPITRQDAADMLVRAFHIPNSSTDALAGFRDSGSIDADVRASVNAIVAASYMGGTSPTRFSPRDHVTGDQARALLTTITTRLVAPPQVMCKPGTTAPRRYIAISTPTPGATIHYTYTFDGSEPPTPDATSTTFELRENGVLQFVNPLNSTTDSRFYRLKAVAMKAGMTTSALREFSWTIVRPAVGAWRSTVVHEATASSPKIWKINNPAEYYQANVYYIEGSKRGLVFDAGEYGFQKSNLKTYVDSLASKPYDLVLGHNHPDHVEQISNFTAAGITCYMSAIEKASLIASTRADFQAAGRAAVPIPDGGQLDLGNVQITIFHAPGHTNGLVTALINQTGWVYASDHFGCNRAYTADTTQYNLIKVDRFLSLQQQLIAAYQAKATGGAITEVTNAHQDFPVGMACVNNFLRCFQQLIDEGESVSEPSIRGGVSGNPTGPVRNSRMTKVGDMWRDKNWMAIGNSLGTGWAQPIDYLSAPTTAYPSAVAIDYNAAGGYRRYCVLSNVTIGGGTLVGVDVYWAPPANGIENKLANRFDPWTYAYTINVPRSRSSITFAPTALSNKVTSITVNGRAVKQGEPVTVRADAGSTITVEVVAPDGSTRSSYTFTIAKVG